MSKAPIISFKPKGAPKGPVANSSKPIMRITPKKAPAVIRAAESAERQVTSAEMMQAKGTSPRATAAKPILTAERAAAPEFSTAPAKCDVARGKGRAELAVVYAGLLGKTVLSRDVQEAIALRLEEPDQVAVMAAALKGIGLHVAVDEGRDWPALAWMTSGQFILVLGEEDGTYVLYDPSCPDFRAYVDATEFEPYFSGKIVKAEAALEELSRAHAPAPEKQHWFWSQFGRFRRHFIEVAVGSFVANLLAVAVALFSLQVYDRVIPHQSEATLWVLAAGAALALLMEALLKVARARLMDGAGRQIELGVQGLLMSRILGMRSERAGQSPSMLFNSMREFASVREFFTASTVGALADIPFIFVFLLLVWSIAGSVVWVLIAGGILMVLPGFFLQKRMIRLTKETQGASMKASRLLHEVIFELDTVKTQRSEDRVKRLWDELNALSAMKSSEQRQLASTLTFWSQGVQQATYVGAVIMGTYLVFQSAFTVGSIIAVGLLTGRTLGPLTQFSAVMARWGNVKAALDGLEAVAEAPQDREEGRSYLRREKIGGAYELHEVKFDYGDGSTVLDVNGVGLKAGQVVAILGSNGSGKSTLLKVLAGLYAPSQGRVLIDGTDMGQIDPRDIRRNIGYLGQEVKLFAGTLRENLNLNLMQRDDNRLFEALDFAGLGQFVKNHPQGLDLEIRDGGAGLSVGQRQSIGWARLWLQDPKVCLLDEPTAALDQTLEKVLVDRLGTWLKGRTAVIATHRVPILKLTQRTLILQNGRMAVDGPRDEVLAHLNGGRKTA